MPRRLLVAAAALTFVGAAAALPAARMTEGPPAGFTGGFGEPTCATCHTGSEPNSFGGSLSLEGLPREYAGGVEYLLTVVLRADETDIAGFQMSARLADGARPGANAGSLQPVDARTMRTDSAGISYVQHSRIGASTTDRNGSTWAVVWTAPRGGGPISFDLAANSGNADNSPLGDLVYTHTALVAAGHR